MGKMVIPVLSLLLLLTACNPITHYQVHTTIGVQFAPNAFVCKEKPNKPEKITNNGVLTYRDSDAASYLNKIEQARADCELKLHQAGSTYQQQMDMIDKENAKNQK